MPTGSNLHQIETLIHQTVTGVAKNYTLPPSVISLYKDPILNLLLGCFISVKYNGSIYVGITGLGRVPDLSFPEHYMKQLASTGDTTVIMDKSLFPQIENMSHLHDIDNQPLYYQNGAGKIDIYLPNFGVYQS